MKSEKIVTSILKNFDNKIWQNLAYRRVQNMAPLRICTESNKILNEFTFLNTNMNKKSDRNIN